MEIDEVWYPAVTLGKAPAPKDKPIARIAVDSLIEKYCEWLNLWCDDTDGNPGVYKPEDFYQRKILAAYDSWDWVVVVEIYDGDEGGTHVLTGYFNIVVVGVGIYPTFSVRRILQEFDTEVQAIWDSPKYVNTPDDKGGFSDN